MEKDKIRSVRQVTQNRHLNFYEMEAVSRSGKRFPYYMASRACSLEDLLMNKPDRRPDGVTIYALYGEKADRVVLIRQYRYPVGDYVYEFPAGLVEEGEDFHDTAVREVREETGLELKPLKTDPMYEKAYFTTDGMTDENCAMVYGYCSGEPNLDALEDAERVQVVLADRDEVRRILKEERAALSCSYMLMHFLHDKDPFAFLKEPQEDRKENSVEEPLTKASGCETNDGQLLQISDVQIPGTVETGSDKETFALGKLLGSKALPGQTYTLIGDLGVGKTVFTQGFAEGLGIRDYVNSPTFTILQVYEDGRLPLYHFDVYRISDPEEMAEVGFEEYIYSDGVSIIEWADLIEEILPGERIEVTIRKEPEKGMDYRKITVRELQ